ncbi:MAG: metalloregulator ArsR/SmtB family transcription factor [Planctomycetota bacterium]
MARKQDSRTRPKLLNLLKQSGPQDAQSLAVELDVSAMAVRQHLYQLQDEKLVTSREEPRPMGRPAKLWLLTEEANRLFPDAHATLAVDLIESLGRTFGNKGLEKLLAGRTKQQVAHYQEHMPRRGSLRKRLEKLAELRTNEGYMAEVAKDDDGQLLFVENHCPICSAASACVGLCASEQEVFQQVLGDKVRLERTEHILDNSRRCVYRVIEK